MPTPPDPPPRLGERLARLEERLAPAEIASAEIPIPELRALGTPAELGWLLRAALGVALRRGPQARPSPARLLAAAQQCAAAGAVPVATPRALRATLTELGRELETSGAWAPDTPPWWAPSPPPSALETAAIPLVLPSASELATAFAAGAAGWQVVPTLIDTARVEAIYTELETAFETGRLELERAGVGADGQVSAHRSDVVRYVSGLESELLEAAPALAVGVQECLEALVAHLARALPHLALHPPQRAMLARYPAPSHGYSPHLDNPGGERDNGRTLTLVVYLNPPAAACAGGEIALWPAGADPSEPPAHVAPPRGGSAVLFDSRTVPHQVCALAAGPARWALTLWLNDTPQRPAALPLPPAPSLDDVLLAVPAPPLAPGVVLFHELDGPGAGRIAIRRAPAHRPRTGIVSTVYRGGRELDAFCDHHLGLGFDHLALVFDHLDEPAEAADAARLRALYPPARLTVCAGSEIAHRWSALPPAPDLAELLRFATTGASNWAIASRQTLNASVVLEAARGAELGGAPLDWLLHLDADERFHLEGAGRGGASVAEHFAAANAAGLAQLRYLNHELLGAPTTEPRFKLNPRLAAARLGPVGWARLVRHLEMAPTDPRPYFHGYSNGKSAVAVGAAASAAGVHGWRLRNPDPAAERFLAGPSVLHHHFASPAAFARKFLAVATAQVPPGAPPFVPAPAEQAALERITAGRTAGATDTELARELETLHERLTRFSAREIELLEAAGLLLAGPV